MTVAHVPFTLPPALESILRKTYAVPPRAYHHFGHVEEVLGHFASVPTFDDPISVALAILFHDAIYRPGQPDNETESAALARRLIVEHLPDLTNKIERVASFILLTARHATLARSDVDSDAALFLDCDMAIVAASPWRFDEYERAIRAEYAAVPEQAYRTGRRAFFETLLASERIFLSDFFYGRFEIPARRNLHFAIVKLSDPSI